MNPEKEPILKQAEIKSVKWISTEEDYLLSVDATIDFDLWLSECDWMFPEGEYDYSGDNNEMHCWLDGFEMHWLVKQDKVVHRIVDIRDKIQELADFKYQEYLHDLELENNKF